MEAELTSAVLSERVKALEARLTEVERIRLREVDQLEGRIAVQSARIEQLERIISNTQGRFYMLGIGLLAIMTLIGLALRFVGR